MAAYDDDDLSYGMGTGKKRDQDDLESDVSDDSDLEEQYECSSQYDGELPLYRREPLHCPIGSRMRQLRPKRRRRGNRSPLPLLTLQVKLLIAKPLMIQVSLLGLS